jgi:hypothetical protein
MVAFMLCFDMGDRLINMLIGMDYSRPKEWIFFPIMGSRGRSSFIARFFSHCERAIVL